MRQTTGGRGQGVGGPRVVHAVAQPHIWAPIPEPGQERVARFEHRSGHVDHVQHGHKRGAVGRGGDGRVQRRHQPVRSHRGAAEQRTGRDAAGRHTQEEKLETRVVQRHHQDTLALQVCAVSVRLGSSRVTLFYLN